MSEQQAVDLLDRVTTDLPVDPGLVAGAVSRGRRLRRRHLVGTAAATVAVLGLTGTGLAVALSGDGATDRRGVDVADTTKPVKPPRPAVVKPWSLAVTAAQVPDTFAALVPGAITELPNKEMNDTSPVVDFLWNGYSVRVGLTADDWVTGKRVPDPLQRCQEHGSGGQACTPGRVPGSFEQTMTWTGPPVDGGVTVRYLTVYYAQGWDVMVMEANAADTKDSPVLAPDVPLSLERLREVAYSDVWFA
jgi:hypothetical protein